MSLLSSTLLRTIRRFNLLLPGEKVIAAISGGVDSMALLYLLQDLAPIIQVDFHVATFDHGLRDDCPRHVDDVVETSHSLGIKVHTGQADVANYAKQAKISIESAARQRRYHFLRSVAHEIGAGKVITAHHADDQAETILMHLFRGSGFQGVRGMSYILPFPLESELLLVRPLLDITKDKLIAYCEDYDIQWYDDESNLDTKYTRNFIRHAILSAVEQKYPGVRQSLVRLSRIVADDLDFINMHYYEFANVHVSFQNGRITIDREDFLKLHISLRRWCILSEASKLVNEKQISSQHVQHGLEVASGKQVGAIAEFPGKVRLRVDYNHIIIEGNDAAPQQFEQIPLLKQTYKIPLQYPGKTTISDAGWSITFVRSSGGEGIEDGLVIYLPDGASLCLRTRRPGDQFSPKGLKGHHQKLKDWMINRKITRDLRDQIPLLEVNRSVAIILYNERWAVAEEFATPHHGAQKYHVFINFS